MPSGADPGAGRNCSLGVARGFTVAAGSSAFRIRTGIVRWKCVAAFTSRTHSRTSTSWPTPASPVRENPDSANARKRVIGMCGWPRQIHGQNSCASSAGGNDAIVALRLPQRHPGPNNDEPRREVSDLKYRDHPRLAAPTQASAPGARLHHPTHQRSGAAPALPRSIPAGPRSPAGHARRGQLRAPAVAAHPRRARW